MNKTNSGLQICARFASRPHQLGLCGHSASSNQILQSIHDAKQAEGLDIEFKKFQTLYPYLCTIAQIYNRAYPNNEKEPFDHSIVEAYWIGNELLKLPTTKDDYATFLDYYRQAGAPDDAIEKRREFFETYQIPFIPHHTFAVLIAALCDFSVDSLSGTIAAINQCMPRCGKVIALNNTHVEITSSILVYDSQSHLQFTDTRETLPWTSDFFCEDELTIGTSVAMHWNNPCIVLNDTQVKTMQHYNELIVGYFNKVLV